ncbi:MAG: HNH endonuclease signature motif containing protein [Chloroflexi bacterium]|nr:HNH endonuclease signature motif containing protein [Chloroflexota bacterium]
MFMDDWFRDGVRKRTSLKDWHKPLHALQGGKCMYCGHKLRLGDGHVDHKKPHSQGGQEKPSNMQLLCAPCNTRKGAQTDAQFRKKFKDVLPSTLPPVKAIPLSKFEAVAKTVATKKAKVAKKRRDQDPFGFW